MSHIVEKQKTENGYIYFLKHEKSLVVPNINPSKIPGT